MFVCHYDPKNWRSKTVALAMYDGCKALGIEAKAIAGFESRQGDVGIAYGWAHPRLFNEYFQAGGHFVYVDLGWWDRKPTNDKLGGFHKLSVDGREPTAYFRKCLPEDRFKRLGIKIEPRRTGGGHILVAGMSEKSARTRGLKPEEWEYRTIATLRRIYPGMRIVYRPKPSWPDARPLLGAEYSAPNQPLAQVLQDCMGVVTHHSNVAVDALVAGVTISTDGGVAVEASTPIDQLHCPQLYNDRESLLADIAYLQWTVREMRTGAALGHLLDHTPLLGST